MQAGIRRLLHDKKKLPIEVIEKCILVYAEKYNLVEILLVESMKKKEYKYLQKFGRHTPQYLHEVEDHAQIHFDMFLSVVTEQTGMIFKYNKKKRKKHNFIPANYGQDFSELAYSGITDDL